MEYGKNSIDDRFNVAYLTRKTNTVVPKKCMRIRRQPRKQVRLIDRKKEVHEYKKKRKQKKKQKARRVKWRKLKKKKTFVIFNDFLLVQGVCEFPKRKNFGKVLHIDDDITVRRFIYSSAKVSLKVSSPCKIKKEKHRLFTRVGDRMYLNEKEQSFL